MNTGSGQLSVTVGVGQETVAVHKPGSVGCVRVPGQTIFGASQSLTVTWKSQLAALPEESVAVQITVVEPTGKNEPDTGVQTVETGHRSAAVGSG